MPIYKFTSFEAARRAQWTVPPDAGYFNRLKKLWALADKLCPRYFPRGIFKFRNIEEANRHRQSVERQRVRQPGPGQGRGNSRCLRRSSSIKK